MLAIKAQFQEIVYNLLHSWKIAPESSWFADIPLIATNRKTSGRLEVYCNNWNFKQAILEGKLNHATDFKAENPICFKKDSGLKIKGVIEASACHFILIFNGRRWTRIHTQIVQWCVFTLFLHLLSENTRGIQISEHECLWERNSRIVCMAVHGY